MCVTPLISHWFLRRLVSLRSNCFWVSEKCLRISGIVSGLLKQLFFTLMSDLLHQRTESRKYKLLLLYNISMIKCLKNEMFSAHYSSPGSRDGYFEMGLDDSVEESLCSSSTSLTVPPAEEPSGHQGELYEEEEEVQVSRILWCFCLQVKEVVEQKRACLVLTERRLGLLYLSEDFTWTNQDAGEHTVSLSYMEAVVAADLWLN